MISISGLFLAVASFLLFHFGLPNELSPLAIRHGVSTGRQGGKIQSERIGNGDGFNGTGQSDGKTLEKVLAVMLIRSGRR